MCGNKCKFDTPNTIYLFIYLFKSFIKKKHFILQKMLKIGLYQISRGCFLLRS